MFFDMNFFISITHSFGLTHPFIFMVCMKIGSKDDISQTSYEYLNLAIASVHVGHCDEIWVSATTTCDWSYD